MTHQEKLRNAIEWLGPRYVFHQNNRVAKGNYETHNNKVSDVAKTFAAVIERNRHGK